VPRRRAALVGELAGTPWPAQLLASVGLGPQWSVTVSQQALGTKGPATYFHFRNFKKSLQPCIIHRKLSVYRKNVNDLSKCSKK
jgi:hypothetical protein